VNTALQNWRAWTLVLLLGLASCAGGQAQREREQALRGWEALVRWSQYDSLVDYIHPEYLAEHPILPLDVQRLHQFRVTEYRVRQVLIDEQHNIDRLVQLRLYQIHTARERVIDHREVWRYDEERKQWLLHSGLPDPRR